MTGVFERAMNEQLRQIEYGHEELMEKMLVELKTQENVDAVRVLTAGTIMLELVFAISSARSGKEPIEKAGPRALHEAVIAFMLYFKDPDDYENALFGVATRMGIAVEMGIMPEGAVN